MGKGRAMRSRRHVAQVVAGVALVVLAGCGDDEGNKSGPTFTEFPGLGVPELYGGSLAWGDVDNDGDLDLAAAGVTGSAVITKVYENDGAGGFSEFPGLNLTGVYYCSLAWGDADNDGDLDLAVAGRLMNSAGYITKVYENDGAGGFSEFPGPSMIGVDWCSLAWGDADNDGDLDLAVAGLAVSAGITKVYENDGAGAFSEFPGPSLTGVFYCSLAWGDADSDGDLDLAVAGRMGSDGITKVYENDGAGGFSEFPGPSLTGVYYCSLAWGDSDNDGDLDLAVGGWSATGASMKIYENDGAGDFAEIPGLSLPGMSGCSLVWGDADNDGDLDLAAAGSYTTNIYENDGAGGFSEFPGLALTGVYGTSLVWGDVDNDGDLDLAVAGATTSPSPYEQITKVYENNGVPSNMPPDQVTGLSAFPGVGEAAFVWSESFDAETPDGGLSYNLRVVDTGSGLDVFPAMGATDGRRRLPAIGPIRPGPSYAWHALTLPSGDYEFRVQAIDSALEGGPWSEPCVFTVP
jgi:hypothetical protein